ncbi:hypothetical protein NSTC731_03339 [Nostoc sp. DSM 114167]|jgi:hypothetical protein
MKNVYILTLLLQMLSVEPFYHSPIIFVCQGSVVHSPRQFAQAGKPAHPTGSKNYNFDY